SGLIPSHGTVPEHSSPWTRCLAFFGTTLVIEPSAGQLFRVFYLLLTLHSPLLIPGSVSRCSVLMAGLSMFCRRPLGQRISTRSIFERSPRPKWSVRDDCDR